MGKLNQGFYKPRNPKKYLGDPNNIVYRSGWELKFCEYLDLNTSVISWGSEELSIKYYNPVKKRIARYYPDFYMEYIDKSNIKKKSLIEVKPAKQLNPPKYKRRTKNVMIAEALYSQNKAKWDAAQEFCLDQGWEWKIFTEKELGV